MGQVGKQGVKGASSLREDRVTDAPHSAAGASSPSGSVPTGAWTRGPWTADDGDGHYWGVFQDDDRDGIAYLAEPGIRTRVLRPEEAAANARLIAAAPDLYEALAEAGSYVREHDTPAAESCLERVLAALARARGEVLT